MSANDGDLVDRMAKRHSVSPAAVQVVLAALRRGGGRIAQFSHAEKLRDASASGVARAICSALSACFLKNFASLTIYLGPESLTFIMACTST
jgi:hypothetical protein